MLEGPFWTFRNPYKKHWSQVWESGIPIGNLGLRSGRVGCWEGLILRFRNPYNIVRLEGLRSGGLESLQETKVSGLGGSAP